MGPGRSWTTPRSTTISKPPSRPMIFSTSARTPPTSSWRLRKPWAHRRENDRSYRHRLTSTSGSTRYGRRRKQPLRMLRHNNRKRNGPPTNRYPPCYHRIHRRASDRRTKTFQSQRDFSPSHNFHWGLLDPARIATSLPRRRIFQSPPLTLQTAHRNNSRSQRRPRSARPDRLSCPDPRLLVPRPTGRNRIGSSIDRSR